MSHYTEDELSAYALRPEAIDDREAVEQHVAACCDCRNTLDVIEAFDTALQDPLPWEMSESMPVRREAPPALLEHARAIATADARARELVMPLVDSAIRFRAARIDDDPRFYTLAVMRLLSKVANGMHERQPQFGLVLADTALTIAQKLPATLQARSAWYAGTAWKERANALRYLGRFKEADEALDRAEEAFESDDHVEPFDLAIVQYVRATLYCQMERFEEAISCGQSAAETFQLYGDTRRYLSALLVEGLGYYSANRDRESAQIMERVATLARSARETDLLGRALLNAANSYTRLRDYGKANAYYADAISVMDDLDLPTESARLHWSMAALKVEQGNYGEGLSGLEHSRVLLHQLGMANDAALATLDLVAGLLAAEQPERVPELCRAITLTFSSEGMMRNAKKALAYLTEAVSSGDATPDAVRHVRAFLEHLPEHPHEEFQQIQ
ncbi:MAG TPA: tetratricopeptide repeat protein [Thermoanaerobaculia bacterium]|jgi:tetratricopeptide (TPR) repeat protein|nr:tetratricopeptide repeat protein [Thermoanaerobaculia bacterium]